MKRKKKQNKSDRIFNWIIIAVVIFSVLALGYSMKIMFFSSQPETLESTMHVHAAGRMSLTPYDKELAREMMDKDDDGKCDVCGMPVEMCMDSGQMQCNMDSKSTIGVLGSQHIHADWKVYIDGKTIDFSEYSHMERMQQGLTVSSFIHVDSGAPAPEKTGDVLHMHATGVPLWIFFDSIGLDLPGEMKFYVNGKEISDYENYAFNDLDKILITDGQGDINQQLDSVTDFAQTH